MQVIAEVVQALKQTPTELKLVTKRTILTREKNQPRQLQKKEIVPILLQNLTGKKEVIQLQNLNPSRGVIILEVVNPTEEVDPQEVQIEEV